MSQRTREEKRLDFALAYQAGPSKLTAFSTEALIAARARWWGLSIAAVEAALQQRIDEEGCAPVFAALKEHLWENCQ